MWDISELYAGEGLFAQLQPSSGPFLWRLQDAARVVLDLFNRGIGYGAAMWAVKLQSASINLCRHWPVGDLWPSRITISRRKKLCTNAVEYNP